MARGEDVVLEARGGPVEGHGEAVGDVGLDLGPEAGDEASGGEALEVPGELRRDHRGAGEGDGDGGAEVEPLRAARGDGEREEGVVLGLAGPQAGESQVLGRSGDLVHTGEVLAFDGEARV